MPDGQRFGIVVALLALCTTSPAVPLCSAARLISGSARRDASAGAAAFAKGDIEKYTQELLSSPENNTRRIAAIGIGRLLGGVHNSGELLADDVREMAKGALFQAIESDACELVRLESFEALDTLGQLNSQTMGNLLTTSTWPDIRAKAARGLSREGPSAFPILAPALVDAHLIVRMAAVDALDQANALELPDLGGLLVMSGWPDVKLRVIQVTARRLFNMSADDREVDAVQDIMQAIADSLYDEDSKVTGEAAKTLLRLGVLKELLDTRLEAMAQEIDGTLHNRRGRAPDEDAGPPAKRARRMECSPAGHAGAADLERAISRAAWLLSTWNWARTLNERGFADSTGPPDSAYDAIVAARSDCAPEVRACAEGMLTFLHDIGFVDWETEAEAEAEAASA